MTSDDAIWFTDPDFGIRSDYEGHRAGSEIGACNVYRIDPGTGAVELVVGNLRGPNGIVVADGEQALLVCDSRAGEVLAYDLGSDRRTVGPGRVAARARTPGFDNIRLDGDGRLWVAAGADGVHCYHQDGTLLGRIVVPELVANINWGGPKRNRLLIAATTSLYSLLTTVSGPQPTRADAAAGPAADERRDGGGTARGEAAHRRDNSGGLPDRVLRRHGTLSRDRLPARAVPDPPARGRRGHRRHRRRLHQHPARWNSGTRSPAPARGRGTRAWPSRRSCRSPGMRPTCHC